VSNVVKQMANGMANDAAHLQSASTRRLTTAGKLNKTKAARGDAEFAEASRANAA